MPTLYTADTLDFARPFSPRLDTGDPEAKREEIRQYFHATYDAYEALFETLASPEAYTTRADPLRHPLIFYYGHTAVFFINKLVLAKSSTTGSTRNSSRSAPSAWMK